MGEPFNTYPGRIEVAFTAPCPTDAGHTLPLHSVTQLSKTLSELVKIT
jgi:hypothetical protein